MTGGSTLPGATGLVVVSYRSSSMLADNLPAPGADGPTVVVVDNYSDDAERKAVTRLAAERGWTTVLNDGNPGFGTGVNAGVDRAWQEGCDVVVLVNPDLAITADGIARLAAAAHADPDALVAPRIVTGQGRPWSGLGSVDLAGGRLWTDDRADRSWLSGACLAFSRALWERAGGFDDDYGMYWEDVDLSFRVQDAGGRLRVLPDVEARHDVGGTQGGPGHKSALYHYYNCRNRLVFAAKHLGRAHRWAWLVRTP
uniref:glycosyltransferase family 2 protein n=1 Tax=Desertihabitans aurantiacus TaxID=2282477 RepID=UPI00130080AE